MKFFFNHDVFVMKMTSPKKKVMLVKIENIRESYIISSTMTLRQKNVMVGKKKK